MCGQDDAENRHHQRHGRDDDPDRHELGAHDFRAQFGSNGVDAGIEVLHSHQLIVRLPHDTRGRLGVVRLNARRLEAAGRAQCTNAVASMLDSPLFALIPG